MIDFIATHPWSCCMAWIVACFWAWSLCAIAGRADDDMEKMGRVYRVK